VASWQRRTLDLVVRERVGAALARMLELPGQRWWEIGRPSLLVAVLDAGVGERHH